MEEYLITIICNRASFARPTTWFCCNADFNVQIYL
jgi:hypothetical protein